MKSMTGFGEAFAENDRYRVEATVRSVNHRFLDLVMRVPDEHRSLETQVGEMVRGVLARGRVEIRLAIEPLADRPVSVELREDLVRQLLARVEALTGEGLVIGSGLSAADVLRLPQVVTVRETTAEWTDRDDDLVRQAVTAALEQIAEAREREGESLRRVLMGRLEELRSIVGALESRRRAVEEETLEGLRKRIGGLLSDGEIPEERLAQEAVILVERSDVREELDRLSTHLDHFQTLATGEGPHGRRLEFLVQEIQRELNTVGGKCRDAEMGREVVDGKVLCEQLREQLLNVE